MQYDLVRCVHGSMRHLASIQLSLTMQAIMLQLIGVTERSAEAKNGGQKWPPYYCGNLVIFPIVLIDTTKIYPDGQNIRLSLQHNSLC